MEATLYTSMRLSPEATRLIAAVAQKLGVTQTAVLERAMRVLARREDVQECPS